MRIAVTGATGFIGSALCRALQGAGHDVVALVRPNSDQLRIEDLNLTTRWADVSDETSLLMAFDGCDAVVHAAGRLGAFGISEEQYHQLHVEGTHNVMSAAQSAEVKKVLYVSSPGVLGPSEQEAKDESAEYAPTNRYERSKTEAELVVVEFAKIGLPVVIVRPEFVYGPGDTHVLELFKAVQKGRIFLIDGGQSYCQPTYIDDAVSGMMLALEIGRIGEIYHIAGQSALPMREFLGYIADAVGADQPTFSLPSKLLKPVATVAEKVGETVGIQPPLTPSAVDFFSTNYRFSTQKARVELGYRPTTAVKDGVKWAADWYREEGLLPPPTEKTASRNGVRTFYPFAMAEGEGVGTAYEYFVKQRTLTKFLQDKSIERILIAGLPQTYGHSSDFLLLAHYFGATVTIIDERADKLGATVTLAKNHGLSEDVIEFQRVKSYEKLDFADDSFDLVLSSEVLQRLDDAERVAFSAELGRVARHAAIFCPNAANSSHVGRSGLDGLYLSELEALFPLAVESGLIDMPPFPPGIALSEEQRESAESGKMQQAAMVGLQVYSYSEKFIPQKIRQRYAHIVYVLV